ncbi:MAG: 3-methyladenine DNA glycosylase [Methanobrevibacter sp.]|uniref:DNA glycosylase n=1 Tax=Methanobrevibacter sp. TaxID=66852 RepID=UPI0026DF1FA1|nr:DNA glycosylase [Methanobrevibacter sp.]MDO5848613.1 3-methyladenine DNA glycosylase [Methanobrevibacter sp.]
MLIEKNIDLDLTQLSGQTSQPPWIFENNAFKDIVFVENKPVLFKVSQKDNFLDFNYEYPLNSDFNISDKVLLDKLNSIFDLNFNLGKFYSYLDNHEKLNDMGGFCNGLRLFIAKNKFEAILSSISSSNNSIARWTKSIQMLKEKWGLKISYPSGEFYSFPDVNTINSCFEDDEEEFAYSDNILDIGNCNKNLKSCGFGYRSTYLKKASEFFTLEMDLSDISKMNYDEAFETVQMIPGVGPKVADCLLLYGYNFREAFPTDVWIKRIVSHLFFDGKDISVPKVREFGMEEFGDYAGYVQLYLFHYARKSGLMVKLKNK